MRSAEALPLYPYFCLHSKLSLLLYVQLIFMLSREVIYGTPASGMRSSQSPKESGPEVT